MTENETQLPEAVYPEMSILGAMLLKPISVKIARAILTEESFLMPAHRLIFRAICQVSDRGMVADPVVVESHMGPLLADVGGPRYIEEIMLYCPSPSGAESYAAEVARHARKRFLEQSFVEALRLIRNGATPDEAQAVLDQNRHRGSAIERSMHISDVIARLPKSPPIGITTGHRRLDDESGCMGWPAAQMSLVMADTGTGKTGFMIGSAADAARAGHKVLYVTVADLDEVELTRRILRNRCGWSSADAAEKYSNRPEWDQGVHEVSGLPLYLRNGILSHSGSCIESLIESIEVEQDLLKRRAEQSGGSGGFDIVFLDYAQKFHSRTCPASQPKATGDACSAAIHNAARRIGIPFVVGSQVTTSEKGKRVEVMTKETRNWLEHAAWALYISRQGGDARHVKIEKARFGPQFAKFAFKINSLRLSFEFVQELEA